MKVIVWGAIIFIFICIGIVLDRYLSSSTQVNEAFIAENGFSIEERIMDIYRDVLDRQPSAKEMVDASRKLMDGTWTEAGMRQRLMDSEEYQRLIKLQSNQLAPELDKMVADRALIKRIAVLYAEERKVAIPKDMVLPLKDVYVALEYNEHAFRAFLRSKNYGYFETDTQGGVEMDKNDIVNLITKHMGGLEKVQEEGKVIAEAAAKEAMLNSSTSTNLGTGSTSAPLDATGVTGATASDKVLRTVKDRDSDMTPMVNDVMSRCKNVFDKDEVAKMLEIQHDETYNIPVRQHYGNMVLRPEMSWSVPQQPPPVCTTLGQRAVTQPVMTNSKLLLGTSLNEASDATGVGSIMPSFQYKEYVPVEVNTN